MQKGLAAVFRTAAVLILAVAAGCEKSDEPLVDVAVLDPTIRIEMRYASTDNFTGKDMYGANRCYLRLPVARRLVEAQARLKTRGYGLKVWDAYRPLSAQRQLWKAAPNRRYVARPGPRARHPRGAAVDITLVDSRGQPVEMPTSFDEFSRAAHRRSQRSSAEARRNLALLEESMREAGFLPLASEWWHFDSPDWSQYPQMDIPVPDVEDHFPALPVER